MWNRRGIRAQNGNVHHSPSHILNRYDALFLAFLLHGEELESFFDFDFFCAGDVVLFCEAGLLCFWGSLGWLCRATFRRLDTLLVQRHCQYGERYLTMLRDSFSQELLDFEVSMTLGCLAARLTMVGQSEEASELADASGMSSKFRLHEISVSSSSNPFFI